MFGLSVRWSLAGAAGDTSQRLREYVVGTSLARFTGKPGLHQKAWRMAEGEWFEGTYVFRSKQDRDDFLAEFSAGAESAPATLLIGSVPTCETFEVVALAEGGAGFVAGAGPGAR